MECTARSKSPNVRNLKSQFDKNKKARKASIDAVDKYQQQHNIGEKLPDHFGKRTEMILKNLYY